MSLVVTSFSNDEKTRPSTLLKTVSTTEILIDQIHKFQNICFKDYLWNDASVLQKTYFLRGCHDSTFEKALPLNLTKTLNASILVPCFLNSPS